MQSKNRNKNRRSRKNVMRAQRQRTERPELYKNRVRDQVTHLLNKARCSVGWDPKKAGTGQRQKMAVELVQEDVEALSNPVFRRDVIAALEGQAGVELAGVIERAVSGMMTPPGGAVKPRGKVRIGNGLRSEGVVKQ